MSTILITGANRGIGLGLVKLYLEKKYHVIACCRLPSRAQELNHLKASHTNLDIYPLNVTNENEISQLGAELKNQSIDLLINNAGILSDPNKNPSPNDLEQLTQSILLESFLINSIAPILMIKAFQSSIAKSERKIIVNISSTLGSIEENHSGGMFAYRASKAALNALTKTAAMELKNKKMIVVAMHPGWVRTDMGGESADLSVEESIIKMDGIISRLSLKDSGSFLSYDGHTIKW